MQISNIVMFNEAGRIIIIIVSFLALGNASLLMPGLFKKFYINMDNP